MKKPASPKTDVRLKGILSNEHAYEMLAHGGHPAEYFARNDMSLETHLSYYTTSEEYREKFNLNLMKGIAYCKNYLREMYFDAEAHSGYAQNDYLDISPQGCQRAFYKAANKITPRAKPNPQDYAAMKAFIDDLESYLPSMKILKEGKYYTPQHEQQRIQIEFVSSPQAPKNE